MRRRSSPRRAPARRPHARRRARWAAAPRRGDPGALNFGIGVLNSIPVQWVVLGVVMILGIAYYAVRHRHLPSPLLAPGRDDVTDDERARAGGA